MSEKKYYVKGMHCRSCEILIEKKLSELNNIKSANASAVNDTVNIDFDNNPIPAKRLDLMFKEEGYIFSEEPFENSTVFEDSLIGISIFLLLAAVFLFITFVFGDTVDVTAESPLYAFFIFGLIAGVSSCAALVGGLVLSMSKQWDELHSTNDSFLNKLKPHLMFNTGRLISYAVLGFLLGLIGLELKFSLAFTSVLVIAVSMLMIFLALQMIGVRAFKKFQMTLPRFISRYASNEQNFQGKYMPFLLGAFTFFLPCGFTLTVQSISLISGDPLRSALMLFAFALGTLPTLLAIGMMSVKFSQNKKIAKIFSVIAGVIVLFFAFYNINSQLKILGVGSIFNSSGSSDTANVAEIVDGKQIMKMEATSFAYSPDYFKIKKGIPVRWEINNTGARGCTNAIIAPDFFDENVPLPLNQITIKEFTPEEVGTFWFSCWMGMVSGTIEVVE
ncbi:sulfite exporter TauE/SafE family protein [Candidatus Gracilibacteria bacterium]|nr:sulfite exporter TauE/SafE family protein [Candidatus Gracilibacteria bacterium]